MAITDNSFTGAELAAAIQSNPALAAELKTFGTASGYHIRDKAEEILFLENFETTIAGRKTSEFSNAIEKDIKDTFGENKLDNEKYHEYLKRVGGASKTLLTSLQEELAALKIGKPDTDDKKRITTLEAAIATEKESFGTKLSEKDQIIHSLKSGFEIEKALGPIRAKYKLGFPDELIKSYEENITKELISKMKEIDGKIVILKADGTPELDTATYQPKTVAQVLAEKLTSLIDEGRQQTGAGTGKGDAAPAGLTVIDGVTKDAAGEITAISSIPADIKSKVALTEWLMKIGLPTSHPIHISTFEKFGKSLVLR